MYLVLKKSEGGRLLLISTSATIEDARAAYRAHAADGGDYVIEDSEGNHIPLEDGAAA